MSTQITIGGRTIGQGGAVYIIAEMSANHNGDLEQARRIVHAAKEAGADAVKLQTYTADTMTLDLRSELFEVGTGTLWAGRNLYDLYAEASTPWEWHAELKQTANDLGLDLFSSPFDSTAVDLLESIDVPAYKIASFELVDIPLIQRVAKTGKPMIMSTGMATLAEIEEAVQAARQAGATDIALLKCTSAYPAPPASMNLRTIPDLAERFAVPVGLSDHTLGIAVPAAAVVLGACIIEKHFTLSRSVPGPDSAFSLEPDEFKAMVDAVRVTEQALGSVQYAITSQEKASSVFRRSMFVVEDMRAGETFTEVNVRCIRPGHGLAPKHFPEVLGQRASRSISRGTPLDWNLIDGPAGSNHGVEQVTGSLSARQCCDRFS